MAVHDSGRASLPEPPLDPARTEPRPPRLTKGHLKPFTLGCHAPQQREAPARGTAGDPRGRVTKSNPGRCPGLEGFGPFGALAKTARLQTVPRQPRAQHADAIQDMQVGSSVYTEILL